MLRRLAQTRACLPAAGPAPRALAGARQQPLQHGCFASRALGAPRRAPFAQPSAALATRFTAAAASQEVVVEDDAETDAEAAGDASAGAEPAPLGPEEAEYSRKWGTFLATLKANGTFTEFGETGEKLSAAGAVKHAAIECGRRRLDAFYDISQPALKAFVAAYPGDAASGALKDRKCFNASKRLTASLVAESPLAVGEGGAASFPDVTRVLWALSTAVEAREPGVPKDMLTHGAQLLEEIVGVIGRQPSEAAQQQADAAAAERREQELAAAEARGAKRSQRLEARSFGVGDLGSREPGFGGGSERSWGGREDSRANNVRPGDWECTDCGAHNFARNTDCFKCSAPKPAGAGFQGSVSRQQRDFGGRGDFGGRQQQRDNMRPGDWRCGECDAHNFARNTDCFKCSAPKSAASEVSAADAGEWSCTECGGFNFARRTECYKCGADRATAGAPAASSARPGGGFRGREDYRSGPPRIVRGGDGRARASNARADWRDGDWECPSCAAHNFASKTDCFRCGVPKLEGAGGGGGGGYGSRGGRGRRGGGGGRGGRDRDQSDTSFGARSYGGAESQAVDLEW